MTEKVYWLSTVPGFCETCDAPIHDVMIDGATESITGPWACMCPTCHTLGPGIGRLGTGLGQKYRKQRDGKWLKIEG